MYDTILVPTDGSDASAAAAEGAIALARRFDSALHAIHVADLTDVPGQVQSEAAVELTEHGENALATVADLAAEAGIDVTTRVVETSGAVHREIVDYAADEGVDLVVMGTQGRTGLDRFIVGSVTERTLRVSPVPVLTVHEDAPLAPDIDTLLVPTDGSDAAVRAADHAIDVAATVGAALHVVHAVDLTAVSGEFSTASVLDALEDAGQRAVDDIVDRADAAGVQSVQASVLTGTPARAILDYADDRDVDLIVMGTRGRTGLDRYLLGSVTEKVVRLAETPVLTVSGADEH